MKTQLPDDDPLQLLARLLERYSACDDVVRRYPSEHRNATIVLATTAFTIAGELRGIRNAIEALTSTLANATIDPEVQP